MSACIHTTTDGASPRVVPSRPCAGHTRRFGQLGVVDSVIAAGSAVARGVAAALATVRAVVRVGSAGVAAWRRSAEGENISLATAETSISGLDSRTACRAGAARGSSRRPPETSCGARPRHFRKNGSAFSFVRGRR